MCAAQALELLWFVTEVVRLYLIMNLCCITQCFAL